jgi:uncharacterized phage-associated protein
MAYGLNEKKAAHVVAYFATKEGGRINIVKLVKFVYLSDREFLSRYDSPILHDGLVAMPHGPVNSTTYDFAKGRYHSVNWSTLLSKCGHDVICAKTVEDSDLDELSNAELEVLDSVWAKFGGMEQWELVKYTHDHCGEWQDPNGSSSTIPYERVLDALGRGKQASQIAIRIEAERALIRSLGH